MENSWIFSRREFFTPEMAGLKTLFLSKARKQVFHRGDYIFISGNPATQCHFIASGLVRIFNISDSGKELAFFLRREEEIFGLSELFGDSPRRASAQALTETVLYSVDKNEFSQLLAQNPELARRCIAVLGARVRILTDRISSLVTDRVESRLIYQLVSFASDMMFLDGENHISESAISLPVKVSQEHLASLTGSTQPTISEILQKFQKMGLISMDRRRIVILNPAKLVAYADMEK